MTYIAPPAKTETTNVVGDKHTDHSIPPPVTSHTRMSSIVCEDYDQRSPPGVR